MAMKLNAPDVKCRFCSGSGARVRSLRIVVDGVESVSATKVLLHCGCLNDVLKTLHTEMDTTSVLREWPWGALAGMQTPKAEGGPEPIVVGSPYPVKLADSVAAAEVLVAADRPHPVTPASIPNPAKAKQVKPKKKSK